MLTLEIATSVLAGFAIPKLINWLQPASIEDSPTSLLTITLLTFVFWEAIKYRNQAEKLLKQTSEEVDRNLRQYIDSSLLERIDQSLVTVLSNRLISDRMALGAARNALSNYLRFLSRVPSALRGVFATVAGQEIKLALDSIQTKISAGIQLSSQAQGDISKVMMLERRRYRVVEPFAKTKGPKTWTAAYHSFLKALARDETIALEWTILCDDPDLCADNLNLLSEYKAALTDYNFRVFVHSSKSDLVRTTARNDAANWTYEIYGDDAYCAILFENDSYHATANMLTCDFGVLDGDMKTFVDVLESTRQPLKQIVTALKKPPRKPAT